MFLAGDIRANENLLLTSMQTVFMREHNRIVDRIAATQPGLGAEQQYQLARKIVGAEIQAVTYNEFLPALLGPNAPTAQAYTYLPKVDGTITNSFAHSAFRFGHSALNNSLLLANANGNAGYFNKVDGYAALQVEKPTTKQMSGLAVVDEVTFTVRLTDSFSQFPILLGFQAFYPMPQAAYGDLKTLLDAYRKAVAAIDGEQTLAAEIRGVERAVEQVEDVRGGIEAGHRP